MTKIALTELDKRNRLLVWIIWCLLALGVVTDISIGLPWNMIIVLLIVGGLISAVATIMTFVNKLSPYVKYVIPFGLVSITAVLIVSDPAPIVSTYFLIYVNMAIVTLYSDYRPIVITGVLGGVLTTYLYMDEAIRDRIFPNDSLMYLYLYLIFAALALSVSAYFAQRLQRNIQMREQEALASKELSDKLIDKLEQSIMVLNEFSTKQKEQVTTATSISHEVTSTFNEMTSAVEQQTSHIVAINDATQTMDASINEMTDSFHMVEKYTEENARLTTESTEQMQHMKEEMLQLKQSTQQALEEMERLKRSNEHVQDIATTINDIASQIHLLALNAAIEAARAGEHGRGFAVVSGEVSKLAEHTRGSVEQISELLAVIHQSIDAAYHHVEVGNDSVLRSSRSLEETSEALAQTESNSVQASEHTLKAAATTESLAQQSSMLADRMNGISATTQQNMGAVQEVNANMEQQYAQMVDMSRQFEKLDQLVSELKQLVARR